MTERFMWARLTASGTACSETALCITHRSQWPAYQGDTTGPLSERPIGYHVDCSGNDQLECQVCGVRSGEIRFTNINPTIDAGLGEAYYFTYAGNEYFVESWTTEDAAGEDIYEDVTGQAVGSTIWKSAEDEAEFEDKLGRIKEAWQNAYSDLVFPAKQQALERALTEVGAPDLDMEGSASRQHYIDTGRYLHHGEAEETT